MNVWELNNIFQDKINHMPPSEELDVLDGPHVFLKLALEHVPECSDPVIGHFELPNRGIKYDGYFIDEDEKEFHVLSLLYFDDLDYLNDRAIERAISMATDGAEKFVSTAERGRSDISTENDVGEHVQELIDALQDGYKVIFDVFTNVNVDNINEITWCSGNKERHVEIHDGNQILDSINADETEKLLVDFKKQYLEPLIAIQVTKTEEFEVYLTSIKGSLLADVYRDHKSRLMDGNVRAYLKRTQKTNKGIAQTLKDNPENFVAYNNGISAIAALDSSDIKPIDNGVYSIDALDKMQIVNGGQTTVTIYECAKEGIPVDDVVVPVKLTVLKNREDQADLVSNIAVFANTQTAISKSDLASNKPFYKNLETLSRTTPCFKTTGRTANDAYFWFFERANGLYNTRKRIIWNYSKSFTKQFPEKNKFSKKVLAKCVTAYSRKPDLVCMGNEKCFQEFNTIIDKNDILPDTQYYKDVISSLILWKEADKIIQKNKLPIKAAVLPYTIAYISEKTRGLIDLDIIWEKQTLPEGLKNVIFSVSNTISNYFRGVILEHPNTLMWGRKKECWEEVKKLNCDDVLYQIQLGPRPINFFPENPAITYINDPKIFNNPITWTDILHWNNKTHTLTKADEDRINDIICSISIRMQIRNENMKNSGKKIFLKAVKNGYNYR